jgi:hypothetical protein
MKAMQRPQRRIRRQVVSSLRNFIITITIITTIAISGITTTTITGGAVTATIIITTTTTITKRLTAFAGRKMPANAVAARALSVQAKLGKLS